MCRPILGATHLLCLRRLTDKLPGYELGYGGSIPPGGTSEFVVSVATESQIDWSGTGSVRAGWVLIGQFAPFSRRERLRVIPLRLRGSK